MVVPSPGHKRVDVKEPVRTQDTLAVTTLSILAQLIISTTNTMFVLQMWKAHSQWTSYLQAPQRIRDPKYGPRPRSRPGKTK